jgi:hypothetical protein
MDRRVIGIGFMIGKRRKERRRGGIVSIVGIFLEAKKLVLIPSTVMFFSVVGL